MCECVYFLYMYVGACVCMYESTYSTYITTNFTFLETAIERVLELAGRLMDLDLGIMAGLLTGFFSTGGSSDYVYAKQQP